MNNLIKIPMLKYSINLSNIKYLTKLLTYLRRHVSGLYLSAYSNGLLMITVTDYSDSITEK